MLRARVLDPWLYRHPFEGRSARRYERIERPAFGDLDARLCERWAADLERARTLIDVGAGPGTFVAAARARWPALTAIAIEPSRDFTQVAGAIRARGEALPLGDGTIDVAVSISSIRHVADRVATFRELRRVVRPGGVTLLVELDPDADAARARRHAAGIRSPVLRAAFTPLVLRTAPTAAAIADLARRAGWEHVDVEDDPVQPVYRMRLS